MHYYLEHNKSLKHKCLGFVPPKGLRVKQLNLGDGRSQQLVANFLKYTKAFYIFVFCQSPFYRIVDAKFAFPINNLKNTLMNQIINSMKLITLIPTNKPSVPPKKQNLI